jgi:diguanylate cyclase (GGDEF)-like protein
LCNQAVRTWARERFKGLGGCAARFEEVLHEFTAIIATADDPATVEAALLRQARRIVPASRIELVTGPAPSLDHGVCTQGDDVGSGSGERPLRPGAGQCGVSVVEVPLRCGSAVRGRMRIRSRAHQSGSLRKETIRRLTTLCTMGACALERLHHHEEWPWDDDVAHLSDQPGVDPTCRAAQPEACLHQATLLHDATFVNAVLPFAFNQARRHHEPLSLVCVAIDRLGGIQELLGRAVVDHLVRNVGQTVVSLIRASDIVARLDDDRIVAVLPRAPGGGALNVAQKICSAVREKSRADSEMPSVTVSIGVATFPSCADNVYSLFDAADQALARAQSQGRNQAALASPRAAITPSHAQTQSRPC